MSSLRLDDDAFGGTVRIGLQVEDFGLQQDRLEQLVEIGALGRRHFDVQHFTAHRFDEDLMAQQFRAHLLRIGVMLVDLVDRHDDRHAGRLGMADRFDRLRHDAVVGRHHQNGDVGGLGAAGAHRREGGVAGRVDEGDLVTVLLDLIGADMLGDAAGFAGDDIGIADRVEQRGLAVIDVAHDGHDRRTRHQVLGIVGDVEQAFLDVGLGDAADRVAEFGGDQFGRVGVDDVARLQDLALLHEVLDHDRPHVRTCAAPVPGW